MTEFRGRTEGEPHDRLTRLTLVMTDALGGALGPGETVRAIVMLDDGRQGGLQIYGYDDETEALADLLQHTQAIFESRGQRMLIMPLGAG